MFDSVDGLVNREELHQKFERALATPVIPRRETWGRDTRAQEGMRAMMALMQQAPPPATPPPETTAP